MFARHGGNLGEAGCVAWIFSKRGQFTIPDHSIGEDRLLELVLEAGADDLALDGGTYEVDTAAETYPAVLRQLQDHDVELLSHDLVMVPSNTVEIEADQAPTLMSLMEQLEDHDDVQNVWANFEIDDEVLAGIG